MSEDAQTQIKTHDDGKYLRTALVIDPGPGGGGSLVLVNKDGKFLALLNIFTSESGDWLAADVIDIEERFTDKKAIVFNTPGTREDLHTSGNLVGVDFRMKKEEQ